MKRLYLIHINTDLVRWTLCFVVEYCVNENNYRLTLSLFATYASICQAQTYWEDIQYFLWHLDVLILCPSQKHNLNWINFFLQRKALTSVFCASVVVTDIVLRYHPLSVKMKDIQVILNRLSPMKRREREREETASETGLLALLKHVCVHVQETLLDRLHVSISSKQIYFWRFSYLFGLHPSQHYFTRYTSDVSKVWCTRVREATSFTPNKFCVTLLGATK